MSEPRIVDADCHILEPPDIWKNWLPSKFADKAPQLVKDPEAEVRSLTEERLFRHPVSRTFHGRDVFAPAGAHLASGFPFEELGPAVRVAVIIVQVAVAVVAAGAAFGPVGAAVAAAIALRFELRDGRRGASFRRSRS